MKLKTTAAVAALVLSGATAAQAAPGDPIDPTIEIPTFAKTTERYTNIVATPEFQQALMTRSAEGTAARAAMEVYDPERRPDNVCGARAFECAGDVRFYDWDLDQRGISTPVVFTARSGATLSGTVWATEKGPAKRPLIVVTTGSVQAPEVLYWRQAATLAKNGYVVLTYDTQGQGLSDTLGEGVDAMESVPAQDGQPFFDNTEDALDFALSAPGTAYVPRPSCSSGTSHAAKQDRRVAEGLNTAYNPLWALVDADRVGIAGHSLGARAVSYVGQQDPRVKAIVGWDNLRLPEGGPTCDSAPATRTDPPITKPALGIANDYGITPTPHTRVPEPTAMTEAFDAYRAAGVDAGELVIRGGCHEESAFVPAVVTSPASPLGCGSFRGNDLLAWYTTAWFDKYVKGDATADSRLLTTRWRDDRLGGEVDLLGDTNVFSSYYLSKLAFTGAGGDPAVCEDLRTGCALLADDGGPADYGIDTDALTPDAPGPGLGADTDGDGTRDGADTCPSVAGPADNRGCAPEETDAPDEPGTPGGEAPGSGSSGGSACSDVRRGTAGPDRLRGTSGGDRLLGRAGDDLLLGKADADCLLGQADDDRLKGGRGADLLKGGRGDDLLKGGRGADVLKGGRGADQLTGGAGRDRLKGGRGDDLLRSRDGVKDQVTCGAGYDRVVADRKDRVDASCESVVLPRRQSR